MEKQKTFNVSVIETLQKEVEVSASSKEEALAKVEKMYRNEEVILCPDDFVETKFDVYEVL